MMPGICVQLSLLSGGDRHGTALPYEFVQQSVVLAGEHHTVLVDVLIVVEGSFLDDVVTPAVHFHNAHCHVVHLEFQQDLALVSRSNLILSNLCEFKSLRSLPRAS